jgi:hypothetical protein
MKPLTLNQTWTLCLKMWKWIAEHWVEIEDGVETLKAQWLKDNGYEYDDWPNSCCFFCEYAMQKSSDKDFWECCDFCPGRLVNKRFNCFNKTYCFHMYPLKFYKKLLELNRKRKEKSN